MTATRLKKHPINIGELYIARARLWELVGAYEKARDDLTHAYVKSRRKNKESAARALLEHGNLGYLQGEFRTSLKSLNRAGISVRHLRSRELNFTFWRYKGNTFRVQGNYMKALACYRKLMKYTTGKNDIANKAVVYNLIGLAHQGMGGYPAAAHYVKRSYRLYVKLGNVPGQGNTLGNIGLIYTFWNKSNQAVQYFQKALLLLEKAQVKNLMGSPLMNWGTALFNLKKYDAALRKWTEALELNQSLGDTSSVAMLHNNIGHLYMEKDEIDKSLEHLNLSLKLKMKLNLTGYLPSTYNTFARVYLKKYVKTGNKNYYDRTRKNLARARSIARSLNNMREIRAADEILQSLKKARVDLL